MPYVHNASTRVNGHHGNMLDDSYPRLTEDVSNNLIPGISLKRLELFLRGPYLCHNLCAVLDRSRTDSKAHVRLTQWTAPAGDQVGFDIGQNAIQAGQGAPLGKGQRIGISWSHHWVKVEIKIPPEWVDYNEPVVFEFDPGCEALIFDQSGNVVHGLTGGENSKISAYPGYYEDRRVEHVVPREAVKAGHYECWMEVSCNGLYGIGINGQRHHEPDMNMLYHLTLADLVLYRSSAHALRHDFELLHQLARAENGERSSLSRRALKAANEIMNSFRISHDEEDQDRIVAECRRIAGAVIGGKASRHIADPTTTPQIWATGHCHIDTAWLWRFTHTRQKIARSWSTQLDLFDRYPSHQFSASSAQQFFWLEQYYPELFLRVQKAVKAGRFIPVGGSWLEHDCVLPSGEALIRQYLYGQRYFQEKFGITSREAWLPDTFGYAPQLPQILRLAGIKYFFTQKLSWNNINVFPHSTFNWAGIDSSQVLAHMTPTDTYNGQANYSEIMRGARFNKNLEVTDDCLLLFGNGDGGGGPTPYMLEKLERLGVLSEVEPEVPSVKIAKVIDFFDHVKQSTDDGKRLPTWRGELYFELHRGTFTSQANIKKGNRTMEKLLRDVEYFGTLASLVSDEYRYPKEQLAEIWKDVLLCDFHDVLPGTSIKMVVDDAIEIYARRTKEAAALLDGALDVYRSSSGGVNTSGGPQYLAAFDSMRIRRRQVIQVPSQYAELLPQHQTVDASTVLGLLSAEHGQGHFASSPEGAVTPSATFDGKSYVLRNADFELTVSAGRIVSIVDIKEKRDLVRPGPGASTAGLMIYEDLPLSYDAWDAEVYHLEMGREVIFEEVEVFNGPLRSALRCTARFGKSRVVLVISMDVVFPDRNDGKRSWITLEASVDWHEMHKFLKFALPLDIHSSYATYGTQFGLIERPTHRNTTVDSAKFESCAHMFGDLSEAGYGVSIVSDHKYGYAVEGNVMRLSLLRSATAPDPTQDVGRHDFSFAIMPHVGRFIESGTYHDALAFVNDVQVFPSDRLLEEVAKELPHCTIIQSGTKASTIILETIKRAEDEPRGGKSVILRMYESMGGRGVGTLSFILEIEPV
ncbi:Glycoside hydrolase, 38 vacuolar alpha mannosidase [Saitozyma podzolica]|uniref:Glycoside hydrolase, 38 vacuolar alpha mannosidase n=1 Tax=Saitozyma podzolica TaxID=1890683 RepID=A0A427YF69_9TREE|nr:Glycoside hydrolase, 38 vacuolar alpha mannosidase [Saitozyma podzolica]